MKVIAKILIVLFLSIEYLNAQKIIIEGVIINQSRKQKQNVEKLEFIALTDEGMKTLLTNENQKADFSFSVDATSPILIRAYYQKESYVAIVSPQELKKERIFKQIDVYDVTQSFNGLSVHSGIQVKRTPEGLEIDLIYAIQNKTQPPMTIQSSDGLIYIPPNATIVSASMVDQNSQIPVNVEIKKTDKKGIYAVSKPLKPGNSELDIKLQIKEYSFDSSIDPIFYLTKQNQNFFKVMIWKPEDAIPEVIGAKMENKNVPNLGDVYLVHYEAETVTFKFEKGSFFYNDPLEAYYNPIFDKPWKTFLGIFLGVFLFILTLSLFVSRQTKIDHA